jgi:hypothetical protein
VGKAILKAGDCRNAAQIQRAIDELAGSGGSLELPEAEIELDRGIELRSGVSIVGQGRSTILRGAPARVYPLNGFQVYGMYDVAVRGSVGLKPGMTVAVRDDTYGDFFETFARLTWVEGDRVGLDRPLASDYGEPGSNPRLITSFPLIFGSGVRGASVRNLMLDGNGRRQPEGIGACRGAALYFIRSRDCAVEDVWESSFPGEGLGFQMCRQMHIEGCSFNDNAGNAFHPGAGSTAALFRLCSAEGNGRCGFFFCARATRITVEGCRFRGNLEAGASIGVLDCHNRILGCTMSENSGPGLLFRPERRPGEVHSCEISGCTLERNSGPGVRGQIDIRGETHDLVITDNRISGESAGIWVETGCRRIHLEGNRMTGCSPEISADPASLMRERPEISCGPDSALPQHYNHLHLQM